MAAQAEQTLASAARRFDPAVLARIGERLLAHLDPDGSGPGRRARDYPGAAGSHRSRRCGQPGREAGPEGGARVLEVLNSRNGRCPPLDGVLDTRTPARRNADALVEAMSGLLDEGELSTRGGQRPHLMLTMKLTDLIDGLGTAVLDTGGCLTAAEARRLACDACVVPMVPGPSPCALA